MTIKKKTIAVDLDGVIHAYSKRWHDGTMYDQPVPGTHEALAGLVAQGFTIVIVTARLNPQHEYVEDQKHYVSQWLLNNGFVKNKHYHEVTNNKPPAVAYIDDRAIAFKNWQQTLFALEKFTTQNKANE